MRFGVVYTVVSGLLTFIIGRIKYYLKSRFRSWLFIMEVILKEYEKKLNKNDKLQNTLALYILLDHGRLNLLNEDYYNELSKDIDSKEHRNPFMTKEYEKQILDISVEMAKLEHNDIYDFIQNEIDLSDKALEKENADTSPDYDI